MPDPYKLLGAGIDLHSLQPHLHRWRFNLKTGQTREERLCDSDFVEFGVINPRFQGRPNRYVYSAVGEPGWFLFRGLIKHDLERGTYTEHAFGEGRFGSEAPFIPRHGASAEDDGYLISFITDMRENRSGMRHTGCQRSCRWAIVPNPAAAPYLQRNACSLGRC